MKRCFISMFIFIITGGLGKLVVVAVRCERASICVLVANVSQVRSGWLGLAGCSGIKVRWYGV